MKAKNFSVLCIKRYEGKYGMVVFFQPDTIISNLPKLKEIKFSEIKLRNTFISKMKKLMGYWHGTCDSVGLKIADIHVIFPVNFEIFTFDRELKIFLLSEYGVDLKIDVGMQINDTDITQNSNVNEEYIHQLFQKGSNLN